MSNQKLPAVVYLDKQRLDFYGSNITNQIVHLDFPVTSVRNMEVVTTDELEILVKAFIEFYKIIPTRLTIILSSNICFEKDLPVTEQNLMIPQVEQFLDNIPFENVNSKTFPVSSGTKIVAVNKDFYTALKTAFEKQGFVIDIIIPEQALKKYPEAKGVLDQSTLTLITEKADLIKQDNIFQPDYPQKLNVSKEGKFYSNPQNRRLIMLVFTFIMLLIILVFLFVKTY